MRDGFSGIAQLLTLGVAESRKPSGAMQHLRQATLKHRASLTEVTKLTEVTTTRCLTLTHTHAGCAAPLHLYMLSQALYQSTGSLRLHQHSQSHGPTTALGYPTPGRDPVQGRY